MMGMQKLYTHYFLFISGLTYSTGRPHQGLYGVRDMEYETRPFSDRKNAYIFPVHAADIISHV